MSKRAPWLIYLAFLAPLVACGGDDDKKGDSAPPKFEAKVDKNVVTVDFAGAQKDAQFLVMPYTLGDFAVVNGATENTVAGRFSAKMEGMGLVELLTPIEPYGRGEAARLEMSSREFDHNLRHLWNRFDPRRGMNQPDGFWQLAQALETANVRDDSTYMLQSVDGIVRKRAISATFQTLVKAHVAKKSSYGAELKSSMNLVHDEGACPATIYMPPLSQDEPDPVALDAADYTATDKQSYCLVLVKGDPATEPDVEKINQSIAEALRIYRDVVYQDTFGHHIEDKYSFKPLIIIAPFDDDTIWPDITSDYGKSFKITGAFLDFLSVENKRPSLYMAQDLTEVSEETDEAKLKELFHSALAHELQHAIFNYYRVWVQKDGEGSPDTAPIDEGLAHLFEDMMGYGQANFSTYAQVYLNSFAALSDPFLRADRAEQAITRGAAQTFFYYLVSQKGGVTFKDGKLSGGDGLAFLRDLAKSEKRGVAAISEAFGGSWVQAVGQFFAALAVDNAEGLTLSKEMTVQEPVPDVTNTAGEGGKTYGMRFNRFGNLSSFPDKLASYTKAADALAEEHELLHYQTKPLLVTIGEKPPKLTLTFNQEATNIGTAVVRVK